MLRLLGTAGLGVGLVALAGCPPSSSATRTALATASGTAGASSPSASASGSAVAAECLDRDMVFSDDGGVHELGTIGGSLSGGLSVQLAVPVMA